MKRVAAALLCLLFAVRVAAAERDITVSAWTVAGDEITLHYTFPEALARKLTAAGAPAQSVATIARYVFSKMSVRRQGATCEAVDQGYDLGSIDARYVGAGLLSFEIFFRCTGSAGPLLLKNEAFFDRSAGLIGLAKVWTNGSSPVLRLISTGNTTITVDAAGAVAPSPLRAYAGMGLAHTLSSIVCLGAACGLLLLLRSRKELGALVGALLAGYLLAAWAGSAGGWFLLPEPAQAFRGFLVVFVGALLIARSSGRHHGAALGLAVVTGIVALLLALLGEDAAALCLAGAGVFGALAVWSFREPVIARCLVPALGVLVGVVNGFLLASMLAPLHEAVSITAAPVFAYDIGAFLGVLAILAVAAGVRLLWRHFIRVPRAPLHGDLVTASLAAVGVYSMLAM